MICGVEVDHEVVIDGFKKGQSVFMSTCPTVLCRVHRHWPGPLRPHPPESWTTGREKNSIIVRFTNELYEPTERLLTIATADNGDAATLTDTIIEEFTTAGLSTEKVIVCMTAPH
jgi:hypothetical protein